MRVTPGPCSQGGKPRTPPSYGCLGKRRVSPFDTSKCQSAVGAGDSVLYCLVLPPPDELLGGQQQQPFHPQAFLLWKN